MEIKNFVYKESSVLFKLYIFVQALLVVLKLVDEISWSWFWVLTPLWLIGVVLILILILVILMAIFEKN